MQSTTAPLAELQTRHIRDRQNILLRIALLAKQKPVGAVSLASIFFMVFIAVFADALPIRSPYDMHPGASLKPPSSEFLFGTDNFGRDLLSRVAYGARISMFVGIGAVAFSAIFGVSIGMFSAYFEGRWDLVIQRIADGAQSIPGLIMALTLVSALGPGLFNVIVAISFGLIPRQNRIVRASVLKEKRNMYVDAAIAIGCTRRRVMWRHIFPNVTAPIIIILATEVGGAILTEASLSFLGVGVPPPNPSWGGMLSGPNRAYMTVAPWTAVFPGIAVSLAVLGFNLFGDALRDVWDPRLRGR